ncbi:MAG TPA: MnhB domain-containing protein [Actinomycetota bacterium]|nr:MnhB domain-containing protein [Actinomycetota bacterium]
MTAPTHGRSGTTLILRVAARGLTPPVIALAVFFLWRGHDAPGGGFIAGLVLGAGVVLRWLAFGVDGIGALVPGPPARVLALGLVVAVTVGAVPLAFGEPFLSGAIWEPRVGDVEVKLASSLVFDVGVTLVVVGMVGAFVRGMGARR